MARHFLDTSALVKHYHQENGTAQVNQIIDDPSSVLFISRLTLVEIVSGFAIKVRTGEFDDSEFDRLAALFSDHVARGHYRVVRLLNRHFVLAQGLIKTHGLTRQIRSLDAIQLAAALILHRTTPIDDFVCADLRLATVAALEGLSVIDSK